MKLMNKVRVNVTNQDGVRKDGRQLKRHQVVERIYRWVMRTLYAGDDMVEYIILMRF